ncbi:hypothetical protein FACS189427_07610 [Planctomycetales bacterium]|nr:hypothetical protein FACS189427_07610 [Planctomycetales bacterium]
MQNNEFNESDTVTFKRSISKYKRNDADMDMTPMVDVVFLLLIFFMVTASFGLQKALNTPPAHNDNSASMQIQNSNTENNLIHVSITAENKVFVEDEETKTPQELYSKLRERIRQSGGQPLTMLVQADKKSLHEYVVRVIDAGSGTGIDNIVFETAE